MPHQDRLNIAVFIDFDNIEIGVKTTLNEHFDVGTILDAIKERGEVVTKIAYADWTRAGEYSRALTQHAIRLVQRNLTPGGDKNGADINLALDALEMAFTHPHINAYVIVGGDSDFLSLVEKLKQYDKKVFVVGGRAFTSVILQRNCHEFIAYENLAGGRKPVSRSGRPAVAAAPPSPMSQAVPIVRRALQILADREVSPQTGLLKSTLLQLDSTFSERNYGASSFLDFVEKLAELGVVRLKHSGRSVIAELNEGYSDDGEAAGRAEPRQDAEPGASAPAVEAITARQQPPPAPAATESAAEAIRLVARILSAAPNLRWPMYVRNVKQALRASDAAFDERRYGFAGLIDLLRACQREGIVRLERDRRGGLRVFPGASLQPRAVAPAAPVVAAPAAETAPGEQLRAVEPAESDIPGAAAQAAAEAIEPAPAEEPTAAARPKRPRAPKSSGRGTRKAVGTRKAAGPRRASVRARRTAVETHEDNS